MQQRSVLLGPLIVLSLALVASAWAQSPAQTNQSMAASPNSQNQPSAPSSQADLLATMPGVLVSTESLLGINVKNAQGQDIGDLKHLMIDSHTGRVMYAVVAMGGFLGLSRKTLVVPWSAMTVTRHGNALVLNLSPPTSPQAADSDAVGCAGHASVQ